MDQHVPRIVGIVATLALLTFANDELKGVVVALVAVTLLYLAVTHYPAAGALAGKPAAGLSRLFTAPRHGGP